MKKIIVIAMLALMVVTLFSITAMAGGGDENYNGEDGDQPAPGADESMGPGEPSDAPETGDRTRNKDN